MSHSHEHPHAHGHADEHDNGDTVTAVVSTLRADGRRITPARLAVLETLLAAEDEHEHLTAEAITTRTTQRVPGINASTVYRTLDALAELDVVAATLVGGSGAVYHVVAPGDRPTRHRHAHVRCRSCGAIADLPATALDGFAADVASRTGFTLSPEDSVLTGVCADCRTS